MHLPFPKSPTYINILESLRSLKKKCIAILITSDKSYKNLEIKRGYVENDILGGKDPYSASKASSELAIQSYIHSFFQQYGFSEIRTPAFENTNLFTRSIGNETDIVSKEMYSWIDQGGNNLTLKPEVTASVARFYIQNNFNKKQALFF